MTAHEQHQGHLPTPHSIHSCLCIRKEHKKPERELHTQYLTHAFPTLIALLRWRDPWGLRGHTVLTGSLPRSPHKHQLALAWHASCVIHLCSLSVMHFPEPGRKYHCALIINGKIEELGVGPT